MEAPAPRKVASPDTGEKNPTAKVALTAAKLDKFVGYYQLEEGALFTVQRRGDFLYAQLNFQGAELLPQDATTFMARRRPNYYCPELGLIEGRLPEFPWFCEPGRAVAVRFTMGGDGNAKELTLYQEGTPRRAPRLDYGAIKQAALTMGHHIRNGRPSPGATAALTKLLESMQNGAPDYGLLTPGMAATLRAQYPAASAKMKSWGALKNLWYRGPDRSGADFYQAQFENALVVCAVMPLTAEGKISDEACRHGPDELKQLDRRDVWTTALYAHSLRGIPPVVGVARFGSFRDCIWPTNVCG
jgi:hypothetical protein